jgi:hypothetical protein
MYVNFYMSTAIVWTVLTPGFTWDPEQNGCNLDCTFAESAAARCNHREPWTLSNSVDLNKMYTAQSCTTVNNAAVEDRLDLFATFSEAVGQSSPPRLPTLFHGASPPAMDSGEKRQTICFNQGAVPFATQTAPGLRRTRGRPLMRVERQSVFTMNNSFIALYILQTF